MLSYIYVFKPLSYAKYFLNYMSKKTHTRKNYFKIFTFVFLVFLFLFVSITLPFKNKVYPNVYIAGIYVGDLTREEALNKIDDVKLPEKITLNINNQSKDLLVAELIKNVDKEKTINRAYNLTNSGNVFNDVISQLNLIRKPKNVGLIVNFDDSKIDETLTILSSSFGQKPVYPSAKIVGNEVVIDKGRNGVEIEKERAINDIKNVIIFNKNEKIEIALTEINAVLSEEELINYRENLQKLVKSKIDLKLDFDTHSLNDTELITFVKQDGSFDDQKIKTKIAEIARKINRDPQDSVFIVEGERVVEFTPSKDGITVNEDKLVEEIKSSLKNLLENLEIKQVSLNIPVIKLEPKIKNEDVNNLGIKTLLGKGVSYFSGSIPNRIHNINLAQSKFKGILVPSGETFSFNQILGDVSAYTGYKAAYVIKDGKTVLGDGGGVCQVSTTIFRAALSAGLPIVERRPHSYRVGYYEQGFAPGLDATVFYPTTDFKFKNDTPNYILIQPTVDNKNYTLTFEIYGTSDGRVATTSKPIITSSTAPAPDLYVDDPSLPLGTTKQIEHRAFGAKVVFDYKVTRNGETMIDQKFVSSYRPWQAVYLRGTGQ